MGKPRRIKLRNRQFLVTFPDGTKGWVAAEELAEVRRRLQKGEPLYPEHVVLALSGVEMIFRRAFFQRGTDADRAAAYEGKRRVWKRRQADRAREIY